MPIQLGKAAVTLARNKSDRPDWFKFWQRNRRQLDVDQLNMESRGVIFTNMMRYFDGGENALLPMGPVEAVAFNVVKINIDDAFNDYARKAETNRENGAKGGRPKGTAKENRKNQVGYLGYKKNPNNQSTEDRGQSTEDRGQKTEVGTNTAGKPPRAPRFTPPSIDEVRTYCLERKNGIDAERFIDYYAQQGWKLANGNNMKDWRAAMRNWEKRDREKKGEDKPFEYDYGDTTGDLTEDL